MGWFCGFKLHFVVNDRGELLACRLTPGNVDDRIPVPILCSSLFGKLLGDKGYLSQPFRAVDANLRAATHHENQVQHIEPLDESNGQNPAS
jgi:transposase